MFIGSPIQVRGTRQELKGMNALSCISRRPRLLKKVGGYAKTIKLGGVHLVLGEVNAACRPNNYRERERRTPFSGFRR